MHHHHDHKGNKRGLIIALLITSGIIVLQFIGVLITNSMALLADSAHMLNDALSLVISLIAMIIATKMASVKMTYGYHRFEILAALFNGMLLFVMAGLILIEAYERVLHPASVNSLTMVVVAFIGFVANLLSAWQMKSHGDVHNNVNLRSAYLHILGDALSSIGVIIGGILMTITQWYMVDPVISGFVALMILRSGWIVVKPAIHILMEGTPSTLNPKEVQQSIESITGVIDVHDLHIWTITSGMDVFTCHLLVQDDLGSQQILQETLSKLEKEFNITHATIQVETKG
ncbi:cation diffusion facilitator family transporter [Alkalihalobacillus sp. TS-13]|uniref:cation diffusion facilitator family transporter n=1 Tax=Alkalihalobacillus sp. TS-13 TaxID=2842455 RepID=UPI001C888F22|nr:cation diffusion facilitator family transporter [Alkalihalobacillus sp. TS-13]